MTTINPSSGEPLAADAIQRVLYIAPTVHVYQIPPITSSKGYNAASWTADDNKRQIFTARLRILETALPAADGSEAVQTDIVLEDPSNGQLFAAAPYTTSSAVEQALDSSRFFALRVQGEGGRRAILGIGFEERSDAFDFGVSLQEVRKLQGMDRNSSSGGTTPTSSGAGGRGKGSEQNKLLERKDFSLKEGETITVNLGEIGRRMHKEGGPTPYIETSPSPFLATDLKPQDSEHWKNYALPFLPPPLSAKAVKAQKRLSQQLAMPVATSLEAMGFDDGEFGEFQ